MYVHIVNARCVIADVNNYGALLSVYSNMSNYICTYIHTYVFYCNVCDYTRPINYVCICCDQGYYYSCTQNPCLHAYAPCSMYDRRYSISGFVWCTYLSRSIPLYRSVSFDSVARDRRPNGPLYCMPSALITYAMMR
jgi:hypothetical protein